jgi:two-component system sensor histidine kinase CpxA
VKRLFLRIFLAFWAAMALVVVVLVASSPYFTRSHPGLERWQRGAEGLVQERLEVGAQQLARRGLPRHGGARRGQGGGDPDTAAPRRGWRWASIFAFIPGGGQVWGSQAPEEVVAFARRVAAAGEQLSGREGVVVMAGRPVQTPDDQQLILVAAARLPPRPVDLLQPGALWWRLGLVAVLVGVLCLWLAHGLAAPLGTLRGTVRRLAAGDLAARAGAPLVRRRDEVGELAREFDAMAERLETLVTAQRRLVRDVSHELRSPLARLSVALELARREGGPGAAAAVERIEREVVRLEELIAQLLTLSRLEATDQLAVREPVQLTELVRQVAADAAFEASARGVEVVVQGKARAVVGDAEALRRAVENVVRNAVAFTAPGTQVVVTLGEEGQEQVVRVRDAGEGLPEEMLEAVFEPFVRAEAARERGRGGAGLGLAIAARAVRLHGGSIAAANVPGGGLQVTLRLPGGVSEEAAREELTAGG